MRMESTVEACARQANRQGPPLDHPPKARHHCTTLQSECHIVQASSGRPGSMRLTVVMIGSLVLTGAALAARALVKADHGAASPLPAPYVLVLGIAQDGGVPQAGTKPDARTPLTRHRVVSLAIVDPETNERWLLEATPDLKEQLRTLDSVAPVPDAPGLAGIFLTHAHMGHYTGLMYLGHESMGARGVPVYTMPRMGAYLETNGPWSQLVSLGNIELRPLEADVPVELNPRLAVTPIPVPHRQEYSEVVAFRVRGPERAVLFVPDIDSWDAWDDVAGRRRLESELARVDVAYLDGTFYADGEVLGRDMSSFPHPRITATMRRLAALPAADRAKVRFIHMNHTNPALDSTHPARAAIREGGFHVARELERMPL